MFVVVSKINRFVGQSQIDSFEIIERSMTATPSSVETYTLYPTNKYNLPSSPSKIKLHDLDLFSAAIHIRNHRFFHRPASLTPTDVVDQLKSSLAEALELYPPVTGTVQPDDQGELCIVMDKEKRLGTPFLVEMKSTPFVGDTEDLSPRQETLLSPSASILAVKVTQVSYHHC